MLYTVAEVSRITNISKVSIYKKLKLKGIEGHISKEAGITYIDEVGLKLITDSLKVNEEVKEDLNQKDIKEPASEETATDTEDLTINKELVNTLIEQLKAKDIQIQALNERLQQEQELHKNTQVLLQQEKFKPQQDLLQLEEHLKEFDNRIVEIREKLEQRQESQETKGKGFLKRIFKSE